MTKVCTHCLMEKPLEKFSFADKKNGIYPIHPGNLTNMVDPLPQALMITTIIIGSAISALALMISIKIYHHYETLNWQEIMEKDG